MCYLVDVMTSWVTPGVESTWRMTCASKVVIRTKCTHTVWYAVSPGIWRYILIGDDGAGTRPRLMTSLGQTRAIMSSQPVNRVGDTGDFPTHTWLTRRGLCWDYQFVICVARTRRIRGLTSHNVTSTFKYTRTSAQGLVFRCDAVVNGRSMVIRRVTPRYR